MEIISKVVIRVDTGEVVEKVSEEYSGKVALCKGGVGKSDFPSYIKWHHKTALIEATNVMTMLNRSGIYPKLDDEGDIERYEYSRVLDDNPYLVPVYDRIAWFNEDTQQEEVIYDPNMTAEVEVDPTGASDNPMAFPAFIGVAKASVVDPDVQRQLRGMDTVSDMIQAQSDFHTATDMLGTANELIVEAVRAMNILVENDIDSVNDSKINELIDAISEAERESLEKELNNFKSQLAGIGGVMSSAYASGIAKIYDAFLSRIHETAAKVGIDLQMKRAEFVSALVSGYINTKRYIAERKRECAQEDLNYAKLFYDVHKIYLKEIRDFAQIALNWYTTRMMPWRDMIGAMAGTTSLSLGKEDVGLLTGMKNDLKESGMLDLLPEMAAYNWFKK